MFGATLWHLRVQRDRQFRTIFLRASPPSDVPGAVTRNGRGAVVVFGSSLLLVQQRAETRREARRSSKAFQEGMESVDEAIRRVLGRN